MQLDPIVMAAPRGARTNPTSVTPDTGNDGGDAFERALADAGRADAAQKSRDSEPATATHRRERPSAAPSRQDAEQTVEDADGTPDAAAGTGEADSSEADDPEVAWTLLDQILPSLIAQSDAAATDAEATDPTAAGSAEQQAAAGAILSVLHSAESKAAAAGGPTPAAGTDGVLTQTAITGTGTQGDSTAEAAVQGAAAQAPEAATAALSGAADGAVTQADGIRGDAGRTAANTQPEPAVAAAPAKAGAGTGDAAQPGQPAGATPPPVRLPGPDTASSEVRPEATHAARAAATTGAGELRAEPGAAQTEAAPGRADAAGAQAPTNIAGAVADDAAAPAAETTVVQEPRTMADTSAAPRLEAIQPATATAERASGLGARTAVSSQPSQGPVEVDRAAIVEQLTDQLTLRIRAGAREARLQLRPPELGTVQVGIRITDTGVHAQLIVENDAVARAIEGSVSELRAALEAARLPVGSLDVQLADTGDGSAAQAGADASDQTAEQREESAARDTEAQAHDADPASADEHDEAHGPATSGGLNLVI